MPIAKAFEIWYYTITGRNKKIFLEVNIMSERYNYLEHVTSDAKEAILEYLDEWDFTDRGELEQVANDELWNDDGVTGNASGSYYCNAWKAEEALCHNWDLLAEAISEFGGDTDILQQGAEICDVTIRCYLLGQAIGAALDELEEEWKISYPAEEEE
jgi:hypothetical protein